MTLITGKEEIVRKEDAPARFVLPDKNKEKESKSKMLPRCMCVLDKSAAYASGGT